MASLHASRPAPHHARLPCPLLLPLLLLPLLIWGCFPGRARLAEDRILEPDLVKLTPVREKDSALELRIQAIRARSFITRSLLHRTEVGEIQADPVWIWSVSPALYLKQALDLVASADPDIRLMDSTRKGYLQIELLAFEIQEGDGGPWARISVLMRLRGPDRRIQVREIEARSAIQGAMPRSLSTAMASSLTKLARSILTEAKRLLQ